MSAAPGRPRRTVIVGAGGAGAPLAARLAADPGRAVVLLEAGDSAPPPPELLDGGALRGALPGRPDGWRYEVELGRGRPDVIARGKRLGGSTAVNGGYFVRATRDDFARWAAAGGPEWSYARALPILRALEHELDPVRDTALHGADGPVRVARPPQDGPLAAAFTAAARELGFPVEADKNAGGAPGVGAVPSNIIDGVRRSTATAYLEGAALEAAARGRLEIRGGTRVLRVIIEGAAEGPRAVGVETERGPVAADEVVLSAGAIATPQLLLLSGIGPRAHLAEHGIGVVAALPVGTALADHPNLALAWEPRRPVVDWEAGYGFPTALNLDAAAVDPALVPCPEGDLEILLGAKPLEFLLAGGRREAETLQFLVALQEHRGRGRLSLTSADPLDPPRIEYDYFAGAEDRRRMRAGVRAAVALLRAPAFSEVFGRLIDLDGAVLDDDAALDDWILARHGTALHTCATAPMGAVVDGAGRVRGVAGLRVADTSILPSAPHRGPANTAVFIGEFLARAMLVGR
ncbi:GMC family oxidoreductase N-terminal domain-containing protein [Leucobacter allii]|uniref:GMC family oxidoreductase n=1 Tax=Leucobacter allii TaxID=2932247 RepID=UPI001FD5A63E|nr:GMC family oxidoreductase N-terminal domain-containing protein [Leucobacter allii]UOR01983.1 GMC family oxidoreductase N-terminal domain-containing protein [Leucobacter allii]